jgi:hypothetical protein|tara:strand:+ start:1209 stop:2339 length:1131 start_codon:yes stop_codon:yes gene_type:complete
MALESTPEIQESADTPMSLDAVLESSIGTSLDSVEETEEAPVENTAQASKEDLTVPAEKHTSPETQVEDSEDLDQLATEHDEDQPETEGSEENPDNIEAAENSTESKIAAPKNWTEDVKKVFETLPPESQEFMIKRDKEMTSDYTKKTQELAEQRKSIEALDAVIQPARQNIQATGIGEAEYISRLLNADHALRTDPKNALRQLAQGYGINLSSMNEESESWNDPDPQYAQLMQQNQQIMAELNQFKQQNIQTTVAQTEQTVEQFSMKTSTDGKLMHPHFDKVRVKMGNLIDAGEAKGLDEAYSKAVRLDDDLYAEAIKSSKLSVKQQEDSKRKAAVDKARKVKPSGSANPPKGSIKASDLDSLLRTSIEGAGFSG